MEKLARKHSNILTIMNPNRVPIGYILFSLFLFAIALVFLFRAIRRARESEKGFHDPQALGIVLGILWGMCIRLSVSVPLLAPVFTIMSIGFLFLSPFTLGYLTICAIPPEQPLGKLQIVFLPWMSAIGSMCVAGLLGFEGAICLIMAAPGWLLLSSIGGIIGAIIRKRRQADLHTYTFLILMLPYAVSGVESILPSPLTIYRSENSLPMACSKSEVWDEIRAVAPIKKDELTYSLTRFMGFPDPVEAKLVGEGVGAIREASFTGGVLFTETITTWEPNRALAFRIRANTEHIPRTTLDEHVTIGGEFFDMLTGRYDIQTMSDGLLLLRLSSEHRLSTHFNAYASLWSRAIMSSIQKNILQVVKTRCEGKHNNREEMKNAES